MTQEEMVLDYLKKHKEGITQRDAIEFGCYRLGARVFDLRAKGHDIESDMMTVTKANGEKTKVARYYLK